MNTVHVLNVRNVLLKNVSEADKLRKNLNLKSVHLLDRTSFSPEKKISLLHQFMIVSFRMCLFLIPQIFRREI